MAVDPRVGTRTAAMQTKALEMRSRVATWQVPRCYVRFYSVTLPWLHTESIRGTMYCIVCPLAAQVPADCGGQCEDFTLVRRGREPRNLCESPSWWACPCQRIASETLHQDFLHWIALRVRQWCLVEGSQDHPERRRELGWLPTLHDADLPYWMGRPRGDL